LLEAAVNLRRAAVYGRYEWVQKSREELDLDAAKYGEHTLFPVNAFTVGASYDLLHLQPVNIAIGGQLSVYQADSQLDELYGKAPFSGEVFLRIYPALMRMGKM
jgi:hypothetical protein